MVTDNISLYSTACRQCLRPVCLILTVVAMPLIKYMKSCNINITRKCTGRVLHIKFRNDNCTLSCLLVSWMNWNADVANFSLFYENIPVIILFLLLKQLYIMTWIMTYCPTYACIITYIRTFNVVTFDTGTNFPAVSWNPLLAIAMMNIRHRWNGIGVPTQSHPNAASLTLSAWNILQFSN